MKKIFLFAIVFIYNITFSQTTFEKGYIINNNDKKINCLIKKFDLEFNPSEISYKLTKGSKVTITTTKEIKEFSIGNKSKYVRESVEIDRSSEKTNYLSIKRNPIFKQEILFLKVIANGNANLYYYKQNNLERFFFNVNDSSVNQLIFKSYLKDNKKFQNNYYKQQLFTKLKCSSLVTEGSVNRIKYTKKDLITFFNSHNHCHKKRTGEKKEIGIFKLSLRPRVDKSSLNIEKPGSDVFVFNEFENQINFSFGFELEYIFPSNRLSIIVEPSYQSFKSEKQTNSDVVSGGILLTEVDYKTLEIPIGIRYYIPIHNEFKMFANASYAIGLPLNSSFNFKREDNTAFNSLKLERNNSFTLGVGLSLNNKYSLELRHLTNRNIISFSGWESEYKTFSIVLGYTLFQNKK